MKDIGKPQNIEWFLYHSQIRQIVGAHGTVIGKQYAVDIRIQLQEILHAFRKQRLFNKQEANLFFLHHIQKLLGFQPLIGNAEFLHIAGKLTRNIFALDQPCRCQIIFQLLNAVRIVRNLLRDDKGKGGSLPIFTVHMDLSIHQCHELFTDCKPQSRSLDVAVSFAVKLLKGSKELVHIALFDTASRICDGNRQFDIFLVCLPEIHLHMDIAFLGKFDRIICQIHHHLLNTDIIAVKTGRQFRIHIHR